MTYRHYRLPGGYERPVSVISRSGRYKLPENYDKAPVGALPSSLPLNQTDPDTDPPVVGDGADFANNGDWNAADWSVT